MAIKAESILLPGAHPPALLAVARDQEGPLRRPVGIVTIEAFTLEHGRVTVAARELFAVVAVQAELPDSRLVKTAVEAMTGIAPAVCQGTVASLPQKGCQTRAVRFVAGEAGGTVSFDVVVSIEEVPVVPVMTLGAEGVARDGEEQLPLGTVLEVAGRAVFLIEGAMNAAAAPGDCAAVVTFDAGFFRGVRTHREEQEHDGRKSQNRYSAPHHLSFLCSFMCQMG
jgi:hypothetical protein